MTDTPKNWTPEEEAEWQRFFASPQFAELVARGRAEMQAMQRPEEGETASSGARDWRHNFEIAEDIRIFRTDVLLNEELTGQEFDETMGCILDAVAALPAASRTHPGRDKIGERMRAVARKNKIYRAQLTQLQRVINEQRLSYDRLMRMLIDMRINHERVLVARAADTGREP